MRAALRRSLAGVPDGELVLVACSGGADSLGLAAALAFVARAGGRRRWRTGAVVVDHGLQEGSGELSVRVSRQLLALGLDPVRVVAVRVTGSGGPEAAARRARYGALGAVADELDATVLLGHTRDDQAETVLLGLARGSGARSLAGMAAVTGRYRRPLLDVARATVRQACAAEALEPWDDPHNRDRSYARVRLRHDVLPALETAVGSPAGAVAAALARTASLLREDADALDELADQALLALGVPLGAPPGEPTSDRATRVDVDVAIDGLESLVRAVRTRVLRRLALAAGSAPGDLGATHIAAVDALVTRWRGQGEAALPTGVRVSRRCGRLVFRTSEQQPAASTS